MVNTRPNKRHARGEANAPGARDTNARRAAGSACSGRSRRGRYRRRRMSKTAVRGRDRRRHGIGLHGSSGRFPQEALPGRVVRVTDGDGLVANVPGFGRLNVRLAYMDAPEHDQSWGPEAKAALASLAVHLDIRLRLLYRDRYARAVAVVSAGDMVFNEELVRHGHAWVYPRYLPACQPGCSAVTTPWSATRGSQGLGCGAPRLGRFRLGSGAGERPLDCLPGWRSSWAVSFGRVHDALEQPGAILHQNHRCPTGRHWQSQ